MKINHLEEFLAKIKSGKIAYGCCITFQDSSVTELAADAGFDFCWIDGEHGVFDRADAMRHIMALRGTNCAPLYRVPACDHTEIKKIIDMAPAGIIVPMVNTADDARRAVSACRYPLTGDRGCGFRRGIRFGADTIPEYLEISRCEPLVIAQIEHVDAWRNLDEIMAVPGLDSVLVGPYDLSASLGKPGRFDDPEVISVLDDICRRARKAGILLGAYGPDVERWKARGVQYLGIVNDTEAMFRGFRNLLDVHR